MSILSSVTKLVGKVSRLTTPCTVDQFKSMVTAHSGLARGNRFNIIITPPNSSLLNLDVSNILTSALSGSFKLKSLINDPRDMALLCVSCSIPGLQIDSFTDQSSVIQDNKLPYGYTKEDVSCSFHLTNDYYVKKMFDKWQALVIGSDHRINYQNEFSSTITIQQLNQQNLPVWGVKLYKAYPITVNSINLDNNDENSVQKLDVVFTYETLEMESGAKGIVSNIKNAIGGNFTKLI